MAKSGHKSAFVGLRLSDEHKEKLERLQDDFEMNKTEILLKGLELMGEYHALGLDEKKIDDELRQLEESAMKYSSELHHIKKREESIRDMIKQLREVNDIIDSYGSEPSCLIQVMLGVQTKYKWLPKHTLWWISERLKVPMARILSIASFYTVFSLRPKGAHVVRVCLGTACHVRGGPGIMGAVESTLGVKAGETTPDGKFTIEAVNCLGCCALGPVIMVDENYHGNLDPGKVAGVLKEYE
jgi:NADH-quinone oxidoreductase subunit E